MVHIYDTPPQVFSLSILCYLNPYNFPSPYRYDNHKLRVIAEGIKFEGLTDAAFNQIRQYGRSDAAVTIRLLEAIATISKFTNNPKYQAVLRHHADMILQDSREGLSQKKDQKDVEERYYQVIKNLDNNIIQEYFQEEKI